MSFVREGSRLPRDDRGLHLLLIALAGCDAASHGEEARVSAPAKRDRGQLCLDLAAARACWDGEERVLSERSLPSGSARGGWRCFGQSADRFCELRTHRSGPFRCDEQRCVQTSTRFPDAAEWDCVDLQGAVVCRSEGDAAGIARGKLDEGFVCGVRRGHESERVCVDLSPDLPDTTRSWKCRMQRTPGRLERVCEPHAVECASPGRSVGGVCIPPRPSANCWLDADCAGRCVQGTCTS